jgi:hypothetical protein
VSRQALRGEATVKNYEKTTQTAHQAQQARQSPGAHADNAMDVNANDAASQTVLKLNAIYHPIVPLRTSAMAIAPIRAGLR